MKIIRVNKNSQNIAINKAVRIIRNGGVVVYPTETAYGLGADFLNPQAVRKIYQIKGRNYKKPLSVIVSSFKMAKEVVKFNQISLKLAKKYWPGALTLILNSEFRISNEFLITKFRNHFKIKNSKFNQNSKLEIDNYKTLGLRISSNKLATSIVRKFGRPITATSANVSGKGECFSAAAVISQFKNRKYQPDLVIDIGKLPKRQMSTIVRVIDNQIEIVRKGAVKLKS